MSFVFPALLGGLALVGIPVLIHLILRQKPITLPFPAFRFLVQKHRTNLRKLRLRHLLLLALRILLIALACLALARPRLFHEGLKISGQRPVAAILLFDTSPSMEYKPSGEDTRLEEAKKRALELIAELPEGSRVALLDTGAEAISQRGDWMLSKSPIRERIGQLQVKAANGPVSARLENAFTLFRDLAAGAENERSLPRLLFVFTDRTIASWDPSRAAALGDLADQVSASWEGLQSVRPRLASLIETLGAIRTNMPPVAGQDYPDQALIELLNQLREKIPTLAQTSFPLPPEWMQLVAQTQRKGREMLSILTQAREPTPFQTEASKALAQMLDDLRGYQGFVIDVGIAQPADLAIVDVGFPVEADGQPRQLFAEDEKIVFRPVITAVGKAFNTTLSLQVAKRSIDKGIDIQPGERQTVPLEVDPRELKLGPGIHSLELSFKTTDALPMDNQRFATFAIRKARRILIIADDNRERDFGQIGRNFVGVIKKPDEAARDVNLLEYQAIFMIGVRAPDDQLWEQLDQYVRGGGGVAVIPGDDKMQAPAYLTAAAKKVLPGTIGAIAADKKGLEWNLRDDSIYQHPLLKPFKQFRDNERFNVFYPPRLAYRYWTVKPADAQSVLASYDGADRAPAILERRVGSTGKVLLFTTPLDAALPDWNNYLEGLSSFFVVLRGYTTQYLAGDLARPRLNFLAGQEEAMVPLPLAPRFPAYLLRGPGLFEQLPLPEGKNELILRQANFPGNFSVEGVAKDAGSRFQAGFSVNEPAEEFNLERCPAQDYERLLGPGSVLPMERKASIREMLKGHWVEPLELFPILLIGLLLGLALESLIANRFYPHEDRLGDKVAR